MPKHIAKTMQITSCFNQPTSPSTAHITPVITLITQKYCGICTQRILLFPSLGSIARQICTIVGVTSAINTT